MFELIIDIVTSKPGLFISGAAVGVIFDEWLTTGFVWLRKEGRDAISDVIKKVKAR